MALGIVVFVTGLVVATGLVATCTLCTGFDHVRRSIGDLDRRIADIAPYLGAAAIFFLLKQATHDARLRLSGVYGWEITDELFAVEGLFVAHLQNLVPEASYGFFSAMYMFGFPYLLLAAPILYVLLPSQRRLKELLVAYVLNYTVGAVCYTLFIAEGPRRVLTQVDGLMYDLYPQTQELTAAVSSHQNVFPSLHTSLSVVALLFAWRTRRTYPRWFSIAAFTASSVVLSTMVLGIHWLSDVVAGVALGAWSVIAASWIVAHAERDTDPARPADEDGEAITSEPSD